MTLFVKLSTLSGIIAVLYFIIITAVVIRIIYDTRNPVKSLAYILLTVFIPFFGMFFYFSFGVNYRKKKFYKKKSIENNELMSTLRVLTEVSTAQTIEYRPELYDTNAHLIRMLLRESSSPLASVSEMKLLLNGENKFPELIKAMENAKDHIHIEYYIYDDDEIGNALKNIMIRKAKEGVTVRFIFDDYGSHVVKKKMMKELLENGVEVYPFYEIKLFALANRMNYRNHRKIVVVDGNIGFIGGLNIADRYINNGKFDLYWRDTHLMFKGNAVSSLQYIFISDWNFCKKQHSIFTIEKRYFPIEPIGPEQDTLQIASSGPDNNNPDILLSYLGIITGSRKRIYITTPYFIPNDTIVNAIKYSALSGVDVRLLVPGVSDSRIVGAASSAYYRELLEAGVRIYQYRKGFVHAKTMVSDDKLSVIGTANMDIRSFDIMFEINANIFSESMNQQLCDAFMRDIEDSDEIILEEWLKRKAIVKFASYCARLGSPLL